MVLWSAPTRWQRAAWGLGLALVTGVQAQSPSRPTTTLTAHAELVSVPVIVRDKSGAHIHGLKKEDFTLAEEGKEQQIGVFEEIQAPSTPAQRRPGPPDQFTNLQGEDSSPRQLTIVVLDMINTPPADQTYAKNEVIKYLTEPGNADLPISLLALNRTGVKLIHHFSNDPKQVATALNRVDRSQAPVTEDPSEAFLTNATDKLSTILQGFGEFQVDSEQAAVSFDRRRVITLTLQSMQQIAQAFAGFPGRKTLVWAGGGFPFTINETTMALKESGAGLDTLANLAPLYESSRMVLRVVERGEVVPVGLDLRYVGDVEADGAEDRLDAVLRTRDRVQAPAP